jgi:hypothetical protein
MRGKFMFSVMVAGAALATGLAAPAYAEEADDIFVSVLDGEGISYPSAEDAVLVANGVCAYMSEGNSLEDAVGEVMKETGLELEQSGFFVGAAAASYCPEHAP